MDEFDFRLDIRLDGKYYCSIYQHGIPLPIGWTDDYDTEEEALEAAKAIITEMLEKAGEEDKSQRITPSKTGGGA